MSSDLCLFTFWISPLPPVFLDYPFVVREIKTSFSAQILHVGPVQLIKFLTEPAIQRPGFVSRLWPGQLDLVKVK